MTRLRSRSPISLLLYVSTIVAMLALAAPLDAATDQPSTFMGEGAHVSLVRVEDALLFEESWRTATLALGAIRLAALANDQGWGDSIPGVPLPFSIAIDGEPTTLIENLEACADPDAVCDSEDLIRVCALRPGGIAHSGAGAYAMLTVTRPREPHPMVREALASV